MHYVIIFVFVSLLILIFIKFTIQFLRLYKKRLFPLYNKKYNKSEHHAVCLHEAAHAVLAWMSNNVISVDLIEINIKEGTGRVCYEFHKSDSRFWSNTVIFLGGLLAECQQYGVFRHGRCVKDLNECWTYSRSLEDNNEIVPPWNVIDKDYYVPFTKMLLELSSDQLTILNQSYAKAFDVLYNNRERFYRLTDYLISLGYQSSHFTVESKDIEKILGDRWAITSYLFCYAKNIFLTNTSINA